MSAIIVSSNMIIDIGEKKSESNSKIGWNFIENYSPYLSEIWPNLHFIRKKLK